MHQSKEAKHGKVLIADLQCLVAAFLFGIGFLGQRAISVEGLGPMTCNAFRFGLSTALLLVAIPVLPSDSPTEKTSDGEEEDDEKEDEEQGGRLLSSNSSKKLDRSSERRLKARQATNQSTSVNVILRLLGPGMINLKFARKSVWFWGLALGTLNFLGSGFQQWGITMTSASKVAFISGFDLFLTPIFGLFIPTFKPDADPQLSTWLAVGMSLVGLFLLSGASYEDFEMGMGETLTVVSTVFWTLHITYTDIATSYVDTMPMMCVQLGMVTFLSAIAALWLEPQQWFLGHMHAYWPWITFLAVVDGIGFALMAAGQNYAPPTHAAIILSLEGVFAAVASYVYIGEHLSTRETIGCVIMLVSTLAAEVGCPMIDKFATRCRWRSDGTLAGVALPVPIVDDSINHSNGESSGVASKNKDRTILAAMTRLPLKIWQRGAGSNLEARSSGVGNDSLASPLRRRSTPTSTGRDKDKGRDTMNHLEEGMELGQVRTQLARTSVASAATDLYNRYPPGNSHSHQ